MTNEQLVSFIQQDGCSSDLLPVLWDRVKKLCFMLCDRFYYKYADSFTACGCELTDCRQECYFSFLEAVRSFKPAKEYLFTSYLDTWTKNKMRELLGINNYLHLNRKPLDNAASLDAALPGDDGKEMSLHDVIADGTSQEPFESLLDEIADERTREAIREALNKLNERERAVIIAYYFENKTLSDIGKAQGVSVERIRAIKKAAFKRLKSNAKLRLIYCENEAEKRLHTNNRRSVYDWIDIREQMSRLEKFGEVLTRKQKQRIIYNHLAEQACEHDPEYLAYTAIIRAAKDCGGLVSPRYIEQLAKAKADAKLTELQKRGRYLSYGEVQAVRYEARRKAEREVQSGFVSKATEIENICGQISALSLET